MRSFAKYISKHLLSFAVLIIALFLINAISFALTFQHTVFKGYGDLTPDSMVQKVAAVSDIDGTTTEMETQLRNNQIWALFLNAEGKSTWTVDVPEEVPTEYTIQDVAVFSKGYIEGYPVFVWSMDDGLLVLGYPQNSYTKITPNYLPLQTIEKLPAFFAGMLIFDIAFLFLAYYISKRRIMKSTGPIIASVKSLSEGTPTDLLLKGDLSEVADSVNKASQILSKQNEARANWISGVSHDIRTPLSMIMGYAGRIANDNTAPQSIREQAVIVQRQSVKIKELVGDLNLVSKLEYEMQPLHKEPVRLSKLLRSYVADLLNTGIPEQYDIDLEIPADAETATLDCDARLISRAVNNLVQNSIGHNPQGCHIQIMLACSDKKISLIVADDGVGLSPEKLKELTEKPHYMECTDERLDLRHGLGLVLVRRITEVHGGTMQIESQPDHGYSTMLTWPTAPNS